MTDKEKAIAYDRALEIAKAWHKLDNNELTNADLETLFPRLKESEDEKIKKFAIHIIQHHTSEQISSKDKQKCIDWLEKQEQKSDIDIDAMVEEHMKTMPEMCINSNAIMNWRIFFNEIARKLAECTYRQGILDTLEKLKNK